MAENRFNLDRDKVRAMFMGREWRQKEFAERAGIDLGSMSRILRGRIVCTHEAAGKMAAALGVDPSELSSDAARGDRAEVELLKLFRPLADLDKFSVVAVVRQVVAQLGTGDVGGGLASPQDLQRVGEAVRRRGSPPGRDRGQGDGSGAKSG